MLCLGHIRAQEQIFCEGYATGLSIALAVRQSNRDAAVLICLSADNMVRVAPMVKGKAYCFADNDKSGTGQRAAEKMNTPFCMSPTEGFDANDEHKKNGLLAVRKLLMGARHRD